MKILNIILSILFTSTICFAAASSMPNSIYNDDGEVTARAYIQDGLINMWDAKENIGWGLHSDTTMVWKDLVGNRDMEIHSLHSADITNQWWTDDSCHVNGATGKCHGVISEGSLPPSQTIQVTLHPTATYSTISGATNWTTSRILVGTHPIPAIYIYRSAAGTISYVSWNAYETSSTRAFGVIGAKGNGFTSLAPHQHTLIHEEDSPVVKYCVDGETKYMYTNTNSATIQNGTTAGQMIIANNASYNYGIDADYYCIRFYNRVLTDKEIAWNYMIDSIRYNLPRKWYPYMNSSWDWADFTDDSVLWSDTGSTVPSEIGDDVSRISNKGAWKRTSWVGYAAGLQRTADGIRGKYLAGSNRGYTNVMIRGNATMFTTNDDWNNIEFAAMLVTKNEQSPTGPASSSIFRCSQWKPVLLFYSGKTLYYRSMTTNSTSIQIPGFSSDVTKNIDPCLWSVRTKAVNSNFNTKISINGSVIMETNGIVPPGVACNFTPAICNSANTSYYIANRDHCETLWWDKIPEDWDLIEKTLMLKYNIKPLEYYLNSNQTPLLGGGFGGVFTGGDTEEPEESPDEEIEESE